MACSTMALIGAKPVPPAISSIGLSESLRRKKPPCGPLIRSRSRSFKPLKTCSVNFPPGIRRTCSCRELSSCGALARENARRRPSLSRISMYCPARNCSRSLAGSLSSTSITSGAARVSFCTFAGRVIIGMPCASRISLALMCRSLCALAQQNRANPAARSASLSAKS